MKFLGDIDSKNLILLDVKYNKVKTDEGFYTDYAMILLKNVATGEKFVYNIREPEMDIWFAKEEYRDYDWNEMALEREKLFAKRVKYRNVLREIVKEDHTGEWKDYLERCKETRNFRAMKNVFHMPYSFGADLDICDYYRCMWKLFYHNPDLQVKLTKCYLDIETDGIDMIGVPLDGACPINAISLTDGETLTCYEFLLRNSVKDNPLIEEFEKTLETEFPKKFEETFSDEAFKGFKYQIMMFDNEVEMLEAFFKKFKELDRDFCGIWNAGYDIPYIIARMGVLGMDPNEYFCDDDFAVKEIRYWHDERNGEIVNKKDFIMCNSRTIFTDCMLNYGKIRKGGKKIHSLKLNNVAFDEVGDTKIDYRDEANIKTLPYVNYILFVLYSMKDTMLMHRIESLTEDIDNVFSRATTNGTAYKAIFSQTKYLKNRYYLECWLDGFISGNNANMDYSAIYGKDEDKEKFDGAVVGDPKLNRHTGVELFGKKSKYVFRYVVDMDFSSMYPWTIISFNISPKTMIGKLIIDEDHYKGNANKAEEEDIELKFEAGKQFVEDILSQDYTKVGRNWFGLPSVKDMLNELEEEYGKPVPVKHNSEKMCISLKQ